MRSLLLSPHCDDEALFASFTILKHRPRVVICFGSAGDYGATKDRFYESQAAVAEFGMGVEMLNLGLNLYEELERLDKESAPEIVWAPTPWCGHPDHRDVADAARKTFGNRVRLYGTYFYGDGGEPIRERWTMNKAPVDDRLWVQAKLKALACYTSQLRHPRASQFFQWDLQEFAEQP